MSKQEGAGFPPRIKMFCDGEYLSYLKTTDLDEQIEYISMAEHESLLQAEQENGKLLREALNSIANSTPGPNQEFELENKRIAQAALKEATSAEGEA